MNIKKATAVQELPQLQSKQLQSKPERRYDIDWLRILAVLLLVYGHTACIFAYSDWEINNGQRSAVMGHFMFLTGLWHMPLLFVLSGMGTWFALGFRTGEHYVRERFYRLIIPLIFGFLVLIPPQVYYGLVNELEYDGSFVQFYLQFFNLCYSEKHFPWLHLWFLGYLFLFSLLALPLFIYFKKEAGQRLIWRLASFLERGWTIFLCAVPLAIIEVALRAKWPGSHNPTKDWANFFFYMILFIYGYLMVSDARFGQLVDKHRKTALIMAIASTAAIFVWSLTGPAPAYDYSPGYILYQIIHSFTGWFSLIAILGYAKKYLNIKNKVLKYANEAVLPFYMLHQTVIVIIGFYVVQWNAGVMEKYIVISTVALGLTIALYDLVVRRNKVTRFLFGMK